MATNRLDGQHKFDTGYTGERLHGAQGNQGSPRRSDSMLTGNMDTTPNAKTTKRGLGNSPQKTLMDSFVVRKKKRLLDVEK